MKTIITTCGSFLTRSEIADAVTDYGLALARARELDVVDIPFVAPDGSQRRARMRIGWLVDTVITSDERSGGPSESETVRDITARSRVLAGLVHGPADEDYVAEWSGTDWDQII